MNTSPPHFYCSLPIRTLVLNEARPVIPEQVQISFRLIGPVSLFAVAAGASKGEHEGSNYSGCLWHLLSALSVDRKDLGSWALWQCASRWAFFFGRVGNYCGTSFSIQLEIDLIIQNGCHRLRAIQALQDFARQAGKDLTRVQCLLSLDDGSDDSNLFFEMSSINGNHQRPFRDFFFIIFRRICRLEWEIRSSLHTQITISIIAD